MVKARKIDVTFLLREGDFFDFDQIISKESGGLKIVNPRGADRRNLHSLFWVKLWGGS
jgi:hypothetical protein